MYQEIRTLILREQARNASFVGVDIDSYVDKLFAKAEFLVHFEQRKCQGFIAYYCNDESSRIAYVSLLLVAPESRRSGLGQRLIGAMIDQARHQRFVTCRLEVDTNNLAAQAFYTRLGFQPIDTRAGKILMESML